MFHVFSRILTWPMAELLTFGDYIFSRENQVQTFISGFHSLSENIFTLSRRFEFHLAKLESFTFFSGEFTTRRIHQNLSIWRQHKDTSLPLKLTLLGPKIYSNKQKLLRKVGIQRPTSKVQRPTSKVGNWRILKKLVPTWTFKGVPIKL